MDRSRFPLKPGHVARNVSGNLWTVLPEENLSAPYDVMAPFYDAIVGNSLYNRIIWGNWASDYDQAARDAVHQSNQGAILDCGCGSLIFTSLAYQLAPIKRMIFFDRSLGMMQRAARDRLGGGAYLQGDALDMPFADGSFGTVMAWGLLHIFGSESNLLSELRRVAEPGARIFLSTLTLAGRSVGDRMLALLHAKGEAVAPETADSVQAAFGQHFSIESAAQRGNMLYLVGRV